MLLFFFVCFVSLLFPPLDIGTPFQTVSNGVVHRVFVLVTPTITIVRLCPFTAYHKL